MDIGLSGNNDAAVVLDDFANDLHAVAGAQRINAQIDDPAFMHSQCVDFMLARENSQ